jgi:hypothetical protein
VRPDERVLLRAEQGDRSFEWLLTRSLAEQLAGGLEEKGWTVVIRPEGTAPGADEEE